MPNQSPIERPGLAGRASELRRPMALASIRLTGASAATGLAMLICVLLASVVQLRAQSSSRDSTKPEDEYHLGYDAGYQAGLRAAKEKLAVEGGATSTSGNQPATTPKDSPAFPATDAGSSNAASRITSLWDEMVNHGADNEDTVFHHSQTSPFWLSAQANFIAQMHPRFHAQYSGPNSLDSRRGASCLASRDGLHRIPVRRQHRNGVGCGVVRVERPQSGTWACGLRRSRRGEESAIERRTIPGAALVTQGHPVERRERGGRAQSTVIAHDTSSSADRDSCGQGVAARFLRPQLRRQRQPYAVHELDRR